MSMVDKLFGLTQEYREQLWRGMLPEDRIAFMDGVTPAQWDRLSLGNPNFNTEERAAWERIIERGRADERKRDAWRAANRDAIKRVLDEHPFDSVDATRLFRVLEPRFEPTTTKFSLVGVHPEKDLWGAKTMFVTLDEMPVAVTRLQLDGFNIFVTINSFDDGTPRPRRIVANWRRGRDFFIDADRKNGTTLRDDLLELVPPDLIVETGNGWHIHYGIPEGDPAARDIYEWKLIERALVAKFGGDARALDVSRALRLPGSLNVKDLSNPRRCHVVRERNKPLRRGIGKMLVSAFDLELGGPVSTQPLASGIDAGEASNPYLARVLDAAREAGLDPQKESSSSETRWLMRCPNPDHDDNNPSFVVLAKPDLTLSLFCRSACNGHRAGDFLEMLGLPWQLRLGPNGASAEHVARPVTPKAPALASKKTRSTSDRDRARRLAERLRGK